MPQVGDVSGGVAFGSVRLRLSFSGFLLVGPGRVQQLNVKRTSQPSTTM